MKLLNILIVLVIISSFTNVNAQSMPDEEYPPIYQESVDSLLDIVKRDEEYLESREKDLENREYLDSQVRAKIKTDLSDLTTKVSRIKSDLESNITEENYIDQLSKAHTEVKAINESLDKMNAEHKLQIETEIQVSYINMHKGDLVKLSDLIKQNKELLDNSSTLQEDMDKVLGYLDDMSDEFKEADWVRFEENLTDFIKTFKEYTAKIVIE